ncbi:MAG: nucleotidyltransferase domain-containing protein [Candidatus Korarchaeum sp.]
MRSLDLAWDRARILREWRSWADRIARAAERVLGKGLTGVFVFGSAVSGEIVASSDVDILIVARNLPRLASARSELKRRILEEAGLPLVHPFEIHLVDGEEALIYFDHIRELLKLR